jgi:Putative phage tail protein
MSTSCTELVHVPKPVTVIAKPHPFSSELVTAAIVPGLTLREIVGPEARGCRIDIAGLVIPEAMWPHVRPKPGVVVYVSRFPQGGGGGTGKMILRLVAFAALAALTYGIATPGVIQGMLPEFIQGLSQGAAFATAAAVGIGGSLLINALIPPAATGVGQQTSPTQLQGISGVQNAIDPYGAIGCVFGTMLVYPKLPARSYTELSGDDQYADALFDLGYGQLAYAQEQIGTDDLANYTDVQTEIGSPPPTLFPRDVYENAVSAEMDDDGDTATRSTETNADEGSLDLIFPSGLFGADAGGNNITATCKIKIEIQSEFASAGGGIVAIPLTNHGRYDTPQSANVIITGDGAGAVAVADCGVVGVTYDPIYGRQDLYGVKNIIVVNPGSGYTHATATLDGLDPYPMTPATVGVPDIGVGSSSGWANLLGFTDLAISNTSASSDGTYLVCASDVRKALRIGVSWKFPARGFYTVRVTRHSTDWGSAPANNRSGSLMWTVLRTIRYALPSTTPTTKLAMRIKATDQLNGTVSQFNLLLSQMIPAWDGAEWTVQRTSNPAWIYRWLFKDCPANPRRVNPSRIDDDALKAWGAECDEKGFRFDYNNDQMTTVFELLKIICACGRASFTVVDNKYSVVRDVAQTVPVQVFTPRNTLGFQGTRAFVDVVHGLRVQFINPQAGYQQDELLVYDDYYDASNASKFEQLQIPGCADAAMAWKLGRYHLAVARLRPNSYSWTCDIEHLVCNRGDLVLFASDVIAVGMGWGRVKGIVLSGGNVTKVTVDESQTVPAPAGTYAMRFRCRDGSVKTSVVTFQADNAIAEFSLTTPTPGINPGDLFLFGQQGEDSIPMLINRIEPTTILQRRSPQWTPCQPCWTPTRDTSTAREPITQGFHR